MMNLSVLGGRGRPIVRCNNRVKNYIPYMKEVLIKGEDLHKLVGSVWIGRVGGSSAVVIPLRNVFRVN